jgi:hypothetical protein
MKHSTNIAPPDFGVNLFVLVCLIAFVVYNLLSR